MPPDIFMVSENLPGEWDTWDRELSGFLFLILHGFGMRVG